MSRARTPVWLGRAALTLALCVPPGAIAQQAGAASESAAAYLGAARKVDTFGLEMLVRARVHRSDGEIAELDVTDGSVLRTGDQVQVQLRTRIDAFVYLLAVGSSGRAVVLRPLSGRADEARVRGGEVAVFPPTGGFLPLDTHTGHEQIFAVASDRPIGNMSSFLARMEGAGGAPDSVTQVVAGAFPAARRVAFRHIGSNPLLGVEYAGSARTGGTPADDADKAFDSGPKVSAPPFPQAQADPAPSTEPLAPWGQGEQAYEEPEVLSEAGKLIAELTGLPRSPESGAATRSAELTGPVPGTSSLPRAAAAPERLAAQPSREEARPSPEESGEGFASKLKRFFGFGGQQGAAEPGTAGAAPGPERPAEAERGEETRPVQQARTFAVQGLGQSEPGPQVALRAGEDPASGEDAASSEARATGEVLVIPPPSEQVRRYPPPGQAAASPSAAAPATTTPPAGKVPQPTAATDDTKIVPVSSAETVLWQAQEARKAPAARGPEVPDGGTLATTSPAAGAALEPPESLSRMTRAMLESSKGEDGPVNRELVLPKAPDTAPGSEIAGAAPPAGSGSTGGLAALFGVTGSETATDGRPAERRRSESTGPAAASAAGTPATSTGAPGASGGGAAENGSSGYTAGLMAMFGTSAAPREAGETAPAPAPAPVPGPDAGATLPPASGEAPLAVPGGPTAALSPGPATTVDVRASDGVAAGVVLVVSPAGRGTGVVVDARGLVLTSWQVVRGQAAVNVLLKQPDGDGPALEAAQRARVVRVSRFLDLALLELEAPPPGLRAVSLAEPGTVRPGARVHAIGHRDPGVWTHIVGQVAGVEARASWYSGAQILHRASVVESKLPADPGAPGTPLFDDRFELVGLGARWTPQKEALTAVSVDSIRQFLGAADDALAAGAASGG